MAESHQEKVLRIIAERNGLGKGPLSDSDRLDILLQMRDDSLCWASECAMGNTSKGSESGMNLYRFACEEIGKVALTGTMTTENALALAGFDPTLVITNGMGERIEA